jgi:hypothetical protein
MADGPNTGRASLLSAAKFVGGISPGALAPRFLPVD